MLSRSILASAMAAVAIASHGSGSGSASTTASGTSQPQLTTDDGNLKLSVAANKNIAVQVGNGAFNLNEVPGMIGDMLHTARGEQQTSASVLAEQVSSLTASLSTSASASAEAIADLQSTVTALRTDMANNIQSVRSDVATGHAALRQHTVVTVQNAHDNQSSALEDTVGTMTALFEEYDTREAGVWEYSFSGRAAINQDFAYWFSIDHGGQGSVNSSHGVADSYSCGNWFLEVEAKAGHCGGGCHVNYFNQRLYLNGYCNKNMLWNRNVEQAHGNTWSVDRVADGHNGHADVCNTFRVRHRPGRYGFGGPYFIRIRSTKPLVVLHSYPWGACSFIKSGINTGVRRNTVYPSRNCPGHRAPPGECRSGTNPATVLGIRTDPRDPLYNNTLFRGSCCVAGQNCPR